MAAPDVFALDVPAVRAWLARHGLRLDAAYGARRLSGGLSNLNYLVMVDGRKAVLRRPPLGELPPGAHDMVREHRVLSRLSKVFAPAPDSFHLCQDTSVIGVHFQLLEYREGLVVQGDRLPAALDDREHRRQLSLELVKMLARLHEVDTAAIGLDDFGKPDGFFQRNVEGWLKRAQRVVDGHGTARAVEEIGDWLLSHVPPAAAPVLLHSDFKLDNCMLDQGFRIATILDWDMSTRGDPLMDLATLLSYWAQPGDPECMHVLAQMPTARPGFLSRSETVAAYGRITGRDISAFAPWRILAMLKLGIIFVQLHSNYARGIAGDATYAGFGQLGRDLIAYTHALLRDPL